MSRRPQGAGQTQQMTSQMLGEEFEGTERLGSRAREILIVMFMLYIVFIIQNYNSSMGVLSPTQDGAIKIP